MIGFELSHNDKVIEASIENGVSTIFLSKDDIGIHLRFSGLDRDINQHVKWFESAVNENDVIKIKVTDIHKVADIIEANPNERDSLDFKLQEYQGMKNYLEREGLLK